MNSQSFDIRPLEQFQGSFAKIRRPKEITSFSFDDDHLLHHDDSSLSYYYPPTLPVDLNHGFGTFIQRDDTPDEHLNALLDSMVELEKEKDANYDMDIITWRGMMTKIITAPYDNWNGFEMNATCFQGTIFIEENIDYKIAQKQAQENQRMPPGAPSQQMMSYWGYKFEAVSVLPEPWDTVSREFIESRPEHIVNNFAQYCSVVRTRLGDTKVVLGGEVDAVWDGKPDSRDDPINWVELKTGALIRNQKDVIKFQRKLLKFWAQSFLLGVPKIIVGFRDENGILRQIEEYATDELPGLVKRGTGMWDGNTCINFAAQFLHWLKGVINSEGIWRIRKAERSSVIEVFKVHETGHGDILSPEFVEWRSRTQPDQVQTAAPEQSTSEQT